MIVKLAFEPMSLLAGYGVKKGFDLAKKGITGAIFNQMHDIPHLVGAKSNRLGRGIQKMILADSIIAAKKGTEGKIYANRKLIPTMFFNEQEGKSIAMMEGNLLAANTPMAKHLFNGNKLNVKKMKGVLGTARAIDRSALAAQVATPTYMGVHGYKQEYDRSHDHSKALKKGILGAATGGIIAGGLEIPRRLANKASTLHHLLSKDNNYGYNLLEDAAKSAEKSMNRPKIFNYSNHFYKTPEENLKGITGRVLGNNFQRFVMGQKVVKGHDSVTGYKYNGDTEKKGILTKVLDKADETKNKIIHSVTH